MLPTAVMGRNNRRAISPFVVILFISEVLLASCARTPETVPPSFLGPTTGQFVNGTQWRIEVFVDADPQVVQGAPGIVLNPGETRQHSLDFTPHRVIAWAYADTQFGTRTVGWYDRTFMVDPYATRWALRFNEIDFHSAAGLRETAEGETKKKLDERPSPSPLHRQDYGTPRTSLRELKRAALQGHSVAQFNLGWMYANGKGGVPQDYTQAIQWFQMAAEQGDAWAQNNLGEMYARGEGVLRNHVQAYTWLSLAIEGGFEPAVGYRERLAKQMTPAQITEAKRLVIQRAAGASGVQPPQP